MSARFAFVAVVSVVAACGSGYSHGDRLKQAVTAFNEGVLWGRMSEVLPRVDPAARESFMALHRDWGTEIRLGGYEIVQTVLDDKTGRDEATVAVSWYRVSEMEERQTLLVQRWEEGEDSEWRLVAEEIRGGTPF